MSAVYFLFFQFLRALWFALRERISCLDELDMCTTRLRLLLPGEPVTDDIHVIHPLQVLKHFYLKPTGGRSSLVVFALDILIIFVSDFGFWTQMSDFEFWTLESDFGFWTLMSEFGYLDSGS